MPKCKICSNEIAFECFEQLLVKQELCNKCCKVFKKNDKNVKIDKIIVNLKSLKNYFYIMKNMSDDVKLHYNMYFITKIKKSKKKYCLYFLDSQVDYLFNNLVIFYKRRDLQAILAKLKVIKKDKKRYKIFLVEVL